MEHRGVEYRIIQGIQRGPWKWSVETGTGTKSGTSDSKDAAMTAAKRAIDNAARSEKAKAPASELKPLYLNIVLTACQNDGLSRRCSRAPT